MHGLLDRRSALLLVGVGVVAVAALSLLFPSSPGYDPWAWIVWGREVAHLELAMEKGPSWKPLPVLFTTPFSVAGDAAPDLWLLVGRLGALLALVFAYRVTARLAGTHRVVAGIVAAGGLLLVADFATLALRGWAEPLLAALVLIAVERHLAGARGAAFVLLVGAALIRPEAWPFLFVYGAYLCWREPRRRLLVAGLLLLVPALWFGPDLIASGDPLRGQQRAQRPLPGRPGLAEDPTLEVLRQGSETVPDVVLVLAGVAFATAVVLFVRRRREGATLVLGLAAAAWIAIVALMAEGGFSGNPRYLFPAAAVTCVLAGVGVARSGEAAQAAYARLAGGRRASRVGTAAAVGVAALALVLSGTALGRLDDDLDGVRAQAELPGDLEDAVEQAGGRDRLVGCGNVATGAFEFPLVAWTLELHLRELSTRPRPPGVIVRSDPEHPEAGPPYARRVETEHWEVLAACGP